MSSQSNRKPALGQRSTSKKHPTLMGSKPEPVIWSCETGQRISSYDSCQLDIIWMSNIKDIRCNPRLQDLVLSPGQTIATCQRNISQHCWAQHVSCVWPPCFDMLRHVGYCWLKFDQFQTWANNTQHVVTHCNTVAKGTQHVAANNDAICCVDMLRSFGGGFIQNVSNKYKTS